MLDSLKPDDDRPPADFDYIPSQWLTTITALGSIIDEVMEAQPFNLKILKRKRADVEREIVSKDMLIREYQTALENIKVNGGNNSNQEEPSPPDDMDNICIVCKTEPRSHTLNCGHYNYCFTCVQGIRRTTNKCAVCRAPIISTTRIYST